MSQQFISILLSVACLGSIPARAYGAEEPGKSGAPSQDNPASQASSGAPGKLVVTVGKSLIIDSPLKIQRISVANGELMEAVCLNPNEGLINAKAPRATTLSIQHENGTRALYALTGRTDPLPPAA